MRVRRRESIVRMLSNPIGTTLPRDVGPRSPGVSAGMIGLIVAIECFVASKLARFH